MTATQRLKRDEKAFNRLLRGEQWEAVASDVGLSRVQLWRRIGDRLKQAREQIHRIGEHSAAS
jgi:hypothetical protein